MLKQLSFLLSFLFLLLSIQMVAAGPAPEQPNNPEFGRGRGGGGDRDRDRDRWTWCRCRIDRFGGDRREL